MLFGSVRAKWESFHSKLWPPVSRGPFRELPRQVDIAKERCTDSLVDEAVEKASRTPDPKANRRDDYNAIPPPIPLPETDSLLSLWFR